MRLAAVLALASLALVPATLVAQDARLEVQGADTVKSVLSRQVGKRVSLVLTAGPELTGTVASVGDWVVHLTGLAGREFLDAVVSLDRIGAVIVRVRGQ